jgi:hypothetical protein
MKLQYYVRIFFDDIPLFEEYTQRQKLECTLIMEAFESGKTKLYTVMMTEEEELSLRLRLNLKGCIKLDFQSTDPRIQKVLFNKDFFEPIVGTNTPSKNKGKP